MARVDRVIPPGGRGEVAVAVNTREVMGPFEKTVTLWTDDPQNQRVRLTLKGVVRPWIALDPGGYLSFWKPGEQASVLIESPGPIPFHILALADDLEGRISAFIEVLKPGSGYRLTVTDRSGPKAGNYTGHLVIHTDHPRKPELKILITTHFAIDLSRRPQHP